MDVQEWQPEVPGGPVEGGKNALSQEAFSKPMTRQDAQPAPGQSPERPIAPAAPRPKTWDELDANINDVMPRTMAQAKIAVNLLNYIPSMGLSLWKLEGEDLYRGVMVPLENVGIFPLSPRSQHRLSQDKNRSGVRRANSRTLSIR